ncbi:early endosome antigen 1 [Galendromus occidentalis]|uniref:Early endosome antigen 1 n=1 Tax=Galendromus occidentalis TaxID=34638 RepID=A0AAJ7SF76_9ACAR|nr:early endosome antigen 1 [Galendromus occidentalis]
METSRQKQHASEQMQQIRDLELQVATLQKKNVELQREMHEALGLQQIKSKAVEALHKDLHTKSDLERRVNDFLTAVCNDNLEAVAEEVAVLRKKCSRSEEYLAELNERYRNAELKNKELSELVAELKSELAVHGSEKVQAKKGDRAEELKNLVKRNTELEQSCQLLGEYKERLVKVEIEKRDLKAENTQLKGKLTNLQRDKKLLQEKLLVVESESSQKLKDMKDAQVRHLEMLSKLRRSHTKIDSKYKHLLKERAQWQSLFRTANGELSRSTESLASISSVASSSVSRTSFFRDSSNLEEYNVHLESELVAVQESLKISERDKERLDRKLKTLAEQVVEDENLIAELDQNRAQLVEERDSLAEKCASLEEQVVVLQRTVEELRDQVDTVLFENNEISMREAEGRQQQLQQRELLPPPERLSAFEGQAVLAEKLRSFYDNVLKQTEGAFERKLNALDLKLSAVTSACDRLRSGLICERAEMQQLKLTDAEQKRQIEVLKNNAESLAKDLGAEVRERSNSEMMRLQDEVNAREAKLKDYEKMQKVLKKALVENEKLKNDENLLAAKIGAAEARVVELESQLKSEQQLVTESNGKLTHRLRQAEKENDRLQSEFSDLQAQIEELTSVRAALKVALSEKDSFGAEAATMARQVAEMEGEVSRLSSELKKASAENRINLDKLSESATQSEALRVTMSEKAQQIVNLIKDLERERALRVALEGKVSELRDECQRHLEEKDSKLANFAEDVRNANRELNDVLRDKARRIEELESQVRSASDAKTELEKSETKVRELENLVEDTLRECTSFVAKLNIPVKPGLELREFVSQFSRAIESQWVEKEIAISSKDAELLKLKSAQEQNASFNQTIEQLKEQLEKDEKNLKRYEEILTNQSDCIEKMKSERQQLEESMKNLQARDTEIIEELRKANAETENELKRTKETMEQLENLSCEKESSMIALQEQLQRKIQDLEENNLKLKSLDALPIMEQRLNAASAEISESHKHIESLSREIAERDEKIRGKNQVIQELETELGERIATFDEMAKVFSMKGEEYKKVRESLTASEEELALVTSRFDALKSSLLKIVEKLIPEVEIDSDLESLSEKAFTAVEDLSRNSEEKFALENEVTTLRSQITEISRLSQSQELRLADQARAIEEMEGTIRMSNEFLEKIRQEHTQTLDSLEVVRAEYSELKSSSEEAHENHSIEVSNLRKLLVESESMMCGLSEQRNVELANLMDKIHCLAKENEQMESREKESSEAHRAELAELLSKIQENEDLVRVLGQEKGALETELSKTQSELDATRADYEGKASELEELTRVLASKQSDMSRFEEKLHALKDRYGEKLQSLQKNLTTLQAEKSSLTNTVSQLETQVEGLENRECELESSLRDKCESLEAIRQEMDILEQKTQEACSQYDETERKLTEREAEVARLVDDLANAKTELSERCEDVNSYHDHVKALAEEKVRHGEEVRALKKRIEDNSDEYQAEALEMQQELSIMTERYNIKCHECETLNKDVAVKTADIEALNGRLASLEAENWKISESLGASQKRLETEISERRDLASQTTRQLELEKADMEQKLRISLKQISTLECSASRSVAELDRLQKLFDDEKTAHISSLQKVDHLQSQLDEATNQLSEIKEAAEGIRGGLEKELAHTREELERTRADHGAEIGEMGEKLRLAHNEIQRLCSTLSLEAANAESLRNEILEGQSALESSRELEGKLRGELQSKCAALALLEKETKERVDQQIDLLKKLSDDLQLRCSQLQLEYASNQEFARSSMQESLEANKNLQKDLCSLREEVESKKLVISRNEDEIEELKKRLEGVSAAELEAKSKIQSLSTQLQTELQRVSEVERSSESSLHALKLELVTAQKKLCQTLEDSEEQTERSERSMRNLRKEITDQKLAASQRNDEVESLKDQLKHSDSAQRTLEKQIEDSKLALDARTTELEALRRSSVASLSDFERELATTRKELARTIEEDAEIRNRLESELESLRAQLIDQKLAMSQLGCGVLKIRDELNGHKNEFHELRHAVVGQQKELSAFLVDLTEKLCAKSFRRDLAVNQQRKQSRLVDRCLETLKQHQVLSLAVAAAATAQRPDDEGRRALESLDTFDVHFQTFNGPTAQFVAEQQASSTAMMKKLAAAMERDDTAPDLHDLHLSNGDTAGTIKVDPFDTIKQQKILIHELMAKLEMTKKVLDGEVGRRKELDERFKSWSTDTRLHNAQVSFNVAQMNHRDDTFDSAPIMDSQKQLIPERSLHVTRQFPTYVESFIRWLVNTAPPRPGALPQN